MNISKSIFTTLCLSSLAFNSYATINVKGIYEGVIQTSNTNCNTPEYNKSWSQPFTLNVSQNGNDINATHPNITDPHTGHSIQYNFNNINAERDGTKARFFGTVTENQSSSPFSGSLNTESASMSFTLNGLEDNCSKSSHITLIKIQGARTSENNSAADAVHQSFSAGDNVMLAAAQQSNNVKTRINTLKHRSSQPKHKKLASNEFFDASQLHINIDNQDILIGQFQKMLDHELFGGAASADESEDDYGLETGFGLFINGNTSFGKRTSSANQQGVDFDSSGVTLGIDYRFTDNFFMGIAFGYNGSDNNYEDNRGQLKSSTYSATLYTTYNQPSGYFIDAVFRYGNSDFNGQRNFINTSTDTQESALSNYAGNDYSVDLETGWEFTYSGLSLQPYIGINISYAQLEAYEETSGSNNTNNQLFGIGVQRAYAAQTSLGADISYIISTDYAVLIPRFNFEWRHDFLENIPRFVNSYTLGDQQNTETTVFNDTPDADFYSIGAGLSASMPYGLSAFLNYNTLVSMRFLTSHNINGGVRWNF